LPGSSGAAGADADGAGAAGTDADDADDAGATGAGADATGADATGADADGALRAGRPLPQVAAAGFLCWLGGKSSSSTSVGASAGVSGWSSDSRGPV
jgi:hypothetical protein